MVVQALLALALAAPPTSVGAIPSNIACMMEGTPAITWTLPIRKPGALLTGLSISVAPTGAFAMRSRAAFSCPGG